MEVVVFGVVVCAIFCGLVWVANLAKGKERAENDAEKLEQRRRVAEAIRKAEERYSSASERIDKAFYDVILSSLRSGSGVDDDLVRRVCKWPSSNASENEKTDSTEDFTSSGLD